MNAATGRASKNALGGQATPVTLMLLVIACYSLPPLFVELAGPSSSLALFTGSWMVAHAVGVLAVAPVGGRHALPDNAKRGFSVSGGTRWVLACAAALPWWVFVVMFVVSFQWVFFAWSVRLIEAAVTTVIYEFWPVLFLLIVALIRRSWARATKMDKPRKDSTALADAVLMLVAATAIALTIFSEQGVGSQSDIVGIPIGVVSAVVALGLAALGTSVEITVGEQPHLHHKVVNRLRAMSSNDSRFQSPPEVFLKVYLSGTSVALPRLAAGILTILYGSLEAVNDSSMRSLSVVLLGAALGFSWAVSEPLYWFANHLSRSDTINSLYYGVPVVALGLLWAFTEVEVGNATMFLAGVTGVVAVNMALHLDPEGTGRTLGQTDVPVSGHGFKALIVALWVSGTVVLLRDDLLPASMLAWAMPEYWAVLAVGATVFVLILSFRSARLTERRREADQMLLVVHAEIEACRDRGLLSHDEREALAKSLHGIDTGRDPKQIGQSYFDLRKTLLTDVHARAGDQAVRDRLRALMRDVEILVNLRQGGRNMVELMVMTLFAALTVFVALFVRPLMHSSAPEPWIGFTVEIFAVAFSSAIGFMVFDLLDRGVERDRSLLREVTSEAINKDGQAPGWRLNMDSYTDSTAHRVLAGLLSGAVFAMFAVLLWFKWL